VRGSGEDSDAVMDSYINEIELLRKLKGTSPYIIDLVDAEVNREEMYIAMVMEVGEIDLAKVRILCTQKGMHALLRTVRAVVAFPEVVAFPLSSCSPCGVQVLSQKQRQAIVAISSTHKHTDKADKAAEARGGGSAEPAAMELLNPFFARMIWQEMLEAVDHIHTHRVVHGDLKVRRALFVSSPIPDTQSLFAFLLTPVCVTLPVADICCARFIPAGEFYFRERCAEPYLIQAFM